MEQFRKGVISEFGAFASVPDAGYINQHTLITFRCNKCSSEFQSTVQKMRGRKKTYPHLSYECKKCAKAISLANSKITVETRYGGHYMKLDKFKDKVAATNFEKYGAKAPAQNPEIAQKTKETNMQRYGCANAQGHPEVRAKSQATSLKNYGTDHPMKNPEVKKKLADSFVGRYGVTNPSKRCDILEKGLRTKGQAIKHDVLPRIISDLSENPNQIIASKQFQEKHGAYYVTIFRWLREAGREDLIPKGHIKSGKEDEIFDWLTSIYRGPIERNVRGLLNNGRTEFDLYLPEKKLAIEHHGLIWHSELHKPRTAHFDKREQAAKQGITVIQIFQDEWDHKQPIVKSLIKTKLGLVGRRIYARNTELRSVPSKVAKEFLIDNHLMGPSFGTQAWGLYLDQELVALATFKRRGRQLELNRFCNKLDTVVVGGLSKLLSEYRGQEIISFVDLRYANGHSLVALGFELVGITLGWKWTDFVHSFNRSFCVADSKNGVTEKQKALELGLCKIYDAGQAKFMRKGKSICL